MPLPSTFVAELSILNKAQTLLMAVPSFFVWPSGATLFKAGAFAPIAKRIEAPVSKKIVARGLRPGPHDGSFVETVVSSSAGHVG